MTNGTAVAGDNGMRMRESGYAEVDGCPARGRKHDRRAHRASDSAAHLI